jgi:hypothetical protein
MDESRKLGLIIDVAKCEIITDNVEVLQKFRYVALDIKHVKTAAAMLLGQPAVGSEQSVRGRRQTDYRYFTLMMDCFY